MFLWPSNLTIKHPRDVYLGSTPNHDKVWLHGCQSFLTYAKTRSAVISVEMLQSCFVPALCGFALSFDPATLKLVSAELVPLLIRLLYPKMRKRSGRLGGKGAPGSARTAILNYLAALEPAELAPLVPLFPQPISAAFASTQSLTQDTQPAKSEDSQRYRLHKDKQEDCTLLASNPAPWQSPAWSSWHCSAASHPASLLYANP